MKKVISNYLEQTEIGKKQAYKNLTMFPLLSTKAISLDYLMLDEALAEKLIEIIEVDKGGSVPELKVKNKTDKKILLLDGEELVGAKQNRIINTTILIAEDSITVIPVSCVEQGRWSYESKAFSSQKRVMSPRMRAGKAEQVSHSIQATGTFGSDQGAIWDEIDAKADRMGAPSPSMAMSSIYEKKRGSIEDYRKHFSIADRQAGALFMINGKVVGLDSFGKPETFSKVFEKLIDSYALDAIDWFESKKEVESKKADAEKFVNEIKTAQTQTHKSVSLGTDVRLESKSVTGFALLHENLVLHLSAFTRPNSTNGEMEYSRMQRFTSRRRSRL